MDIAREELGIPQTVLDAYIKDRKEGRDNSLVTKLRRGERKQPLREEDQRRLLEAFGCTTPEELNVLAQSLKTAQHVRDQHFFGTLTGLQSQREDFPENIAEQIAGKKEKKNERFTPAQAHAALGELGVSELTLYRKAKVKLQPDEQTAVEAATAFVQGCDKSRFDAYGAEESVNPRVGALRRGAVVSR